MIMSKLQDVWKTDNYYQKARNAILSSQSDEIHLLIELGKNAKRILDIGCGEGTRLFLVSGKKAKGIGVDISEKAIRLAGRQYPQFNFCVADSSRLPFASNTFDLVYSAFVLEHVLDPEKIINEAIRVTKSGGLICFIAPNYGAPNRCSPNFNGSRFIKLCAGIILDMAIAFKNSTTLKWNSVQPKSGKIYEMDSDTTVEPYINSLISYLVANRLIIKKYDSCWKEELAGAKMHQQLFAFFAKIGFYPFKMWGPRLLIVAKKT